MRAFLIAAIAVGLTCTVRASFAQVPPAGAANLARISALLRQLGDAEYAQREAATKALTEIGEPALEGLQAAQAGKDIEVSTRAAAAIRAITTRMAAAAATKQIAKFQGEWVGNDGLWFTIKGDRWSSGTATFGPVSGPLVGVDVRKDLTLANMVVDDGATKGHTVYAIFHLEGDTLQYCGAYDTDRPTVFRNSDANVFFAYQRKKQGDAPMQRPQVVEPPPIAEANPADIDIQCDAFSTDLVVAESKTPVHRVLLKGRLAQGGRGSLVLDPNRPKFDEFGQPKADDKPAPTVTLECLFKLVKSDAGVHRFEIRGPRIASRMFLVSGVGLPYRFLVEDKNGAVRYMLSLQQQQQEKLFPPCHPGCFPAGTLVLVGKGTKPIERIGKGELVATIDAAGKLALAKVTGVFVTKNRLVEVRVNGDKLLTTTTQPIALERGGFLPAGELKKGDRIWRWAEDKRQATVVVEVAAANRVSEVFNLVLDEPKGFVANGFVVRSKPPAPNVEPVPAMLPVAVSP